jgi:glycosyltransferase involved in cell wall biosynthesis
LIQLAEDPVLRERLGRRGQEFVTERFDVGRMIADLHGLYLKLARARGINVS